MQTIDWSLLRKDFPILNQTLPNGSRLVYLDSAASSQKPKQVIQSLVHYYTTDHSNVHRGIHELSNRATAAYEAARARAAKFLNAGSADEIVFTRGTTEGLNLLATAWGQKHIKKGDVILLTELEHHSNIVPWQNLAERTGAKLQFVPVNGAAGIIDTDKLFSMFESGVKIFSFTHISNTTGTINPVAEWCQRAKEKGITTIIDAAQSAGHLTVDVQQINCDFLVFSGHKVCGPTGIGVLYGKAEKLAETPPYQFGGEMINTVEWQSSKYKLPPHRFEAGTPSIADAIGLHTALDYLDAIGRDQIFNHDQALAAYAYEKLRHLSKDIVLLGPSGASKVSGDKIGDKIRGGLVSFAVPDVHAHDIVTFADQQGVALRGGHHCCQPLHRKLGLKSSVRASFYFYNDQQEVDLFIESIEKALAFFRRG